MRIAVCEIRGEVEPRKRSPEHLRVGQRAGGVERQRILATAFALDVKGGIDPAAVTVGGERRDIEAASHLLHVEIRDLARGGIARRTVTHAEGPLRPLPDLRARERRGSERDVSREHRAAPGYAVVELQVARDTR